jgi:hypothetical protein
MSRYWVTDPDAYLEPKIGKSGFEARVPKTVVDVFKETLAKHGDRKALFLKRAVKVKGIRYNPLRKV